VPPVGGEMRARELWEMSIRRKEKLRARPQPRVIDRSLFATPSVSFYLSLDSAILNYPATNKKKRKEYGRESARAQGPGWPTVSGPEAPGTPAAW
jgi:hypothetical protein